MKGRSLENGSKAAWITGGCAVVAAVIAAVATIAAANINSRNKELEAELARLEATIASMQQPAAVNAEQDDWIQWSDAAQAEGWSDEMWFLSRTSSFLMDGKQWRNGFYTDEAEAWARYRLNSNGFTKLKFTVGALDVFPGTGYSKASLCVKFDETGVEWIYLSSNMDAAEYTYEIPKGTKEITFWLINEGDDGMRPAYGIGELRAG